MATRPKQYTGRNVYEAALDRLRYLYRRFDRIVVNFSGGKDSTALLNLTVQVAGELNRLPVDAIFLDEEAIHPPTIEYVERVYRRNDVRLQWFCLPIKHRNACSNEQPYWYCWNPSERHLWVREPPPWAIFNHPKFEWGMGLGEFADVMWDRADGTIVNITGVRTQESFRRMKAVSIKKNDNYITAKGNLGYIYKAHPIYDWSSEDVWLYVNQFGIDYNRTYDVFNKTRHYNKLLAQRVCPPFGEEPLRGLWLYAECFPEMWHKMLNRVPGVGTAWRYSNTELYGVGDIDKPKGITWQEYIEYVVETYHPKERPAVQKNVRSIINRHIAKTADPIPEEEPHPLTGTSWKFLCKIAIKGDLKGRTAPKLEQEAIKQQKKLGLGSYERAKELFGRKPANQPRAVDASRQAEAEPLQPKRGGAT